MKQAMLTKLVLIFFSFNSNTSFAISNFSFICPDKFQAKVESIQEVESTHFPKVEVTFAVTENFKGQKFNSKKIEVIKDGPVQFKTGEIYTIDSRDKWLCDAKLISKK